MLVKHPVKLGCQILPLLSIMVSKIRVSKSSVIIDAKNLSVSKVHRCQIYWCQKSMHFKIYSVKSSGCFEPFELCTKSNIISGTMNPIWLYGLPLGLIVTTSRTGNVVFNSYLCGSDIVRIPVFPKSIVT